MYEERERKPLHEIVVHFRQFKLRPDGTKVLKNNGGITVLVTKKANDSYLVAEARCGKNDNFSRKIGLSIVKGRAKCTRRATFAVLLKQDVIQRLNYYKAKYHENFDDSFVERLVSKLV